MKIYEYFANLKKHEKHDKKFIIHNRSLKLWFFESKKVYLFAKMISKFKTT